MGGLGYTLPLRRLHSVALAKEEPRLAMLGGRAAEPFQGGEELGRIPPLESTLPAAPRGASGNAGGNRCLMPVPCVPTEVAAMA
jgi:hypothetical protein